LGGRPGGGPRENKPLSDACLLQKRGKPDASDQEEKRNERKEQSECLEKAFQKTEQGFLVRKPKTTERKKIEENPERGPTKKGDRWLRAEGSTQKNHRRDQTWGKKSDQLIQAKRNNLRGVNSRPQKPLTKARKKKEGGTEVGSGDGATICREGKRGGSSVKRTGRTRKNGVEEERGER